jgi:hypothetical protein
MDPLGRRSMTTDDRAIEELESGGVLEWQERQQREDERASRPLITTKSNKADVL